MEVFIGFRPSHLELGPQDIKGRVGLVIIENEEELIGHCGQFAFGAPSRFAPSRSGLHSYLIQVLLGCLVDVPEDGQQRVKLGSG
jgi:hypothetical protein